MKPKMTNGFLGWNTGSCLFPFQTFLQEIHLGLTIRAMANMHFRPGIVSGVLPG
jgi:hypothetical protein